MSLPLRRKSRSPVVADAFLPGGVRNGNHHSCGAVTDLGFHNQSLITMVTKNLFSLAAVSAKCLCLVAALATAFSLASCSDDDDDDEVDSYSIVDTWVWEKTYDDGDYILRTLVFESDGTGSATYYYKASGGNTATSFTDYFEYSFNQDDSELTVVLTEEGNESYYAYFSTTGVYSAYVTKTQLTVESASGTEYIFTRQ